MFKVKLLVTLSVKLSTVFKVELAITLSVKLSTSLKVELSQFEEVCHFFSKICHMNFILHAQFPLFVFNDLWFFVFNYIHIQTPSYVFGKFSSLFFLFSFIVSRFLFMNCFVVFSWNTLRFESFACCMCSMPIPIFGASIVTFLVMQLLSFMNCVFTSHFCIFNAMEFLFFGYYNVFASPSHWNFCLPTITLLLKYNAIYLFRIVPPHFNFNFKLVATFGKVSLKISLFFFKVF